jgi:hypothetical protein
MVLCLPRLGRGLRAAVVLAAWPEPPDRQTSSAARHISARRPPPAAAEARRLQLDWSLPTPELIGDQPRSAPGIRTRLWFTFPPAPTSDLPSRWAPANQRNASHSLCLPSLPFLCYLNSRLFLTAYGWFAYKTEHSDFLCWYFIYDAH